MVTKMLLLLFTLLCLTYRAEAASFEVLPRLCISAPSEPCRIEVKVSWHYPRVLCLVIKGDDPSLNQAPRHCGADVDQWRLQLTVRDSVTLVLKDGLQVIAEREVKQMQAIENKLHQRRLSWSLF